MTTYLLTGATGTFGHAFVRWALKYEPQSIVRCYSRGEHAQSLMEAEFHDERLRFLIGDVRDQQRLERAMYGVDVVVHAAALKQVPRLEYNPREAVLTNVLGSMNVIEAAINVGVKKCLLISTDKAVRPINLYGVTKAAAEKLWIESNAYSGRRGAFSAVRYGNVVGSRGSVFEVWERQLTTLGYITITNPSMTRFLITPEQAIKFVMKVLGAMQGGEVFVPRLPTAHVQELVGAFILGAEMPVETRTIGMRPGEKMHEELISDEESYRTKPWAMENDVEPGFIVYPEPVKRALNRGYRSDVNYQWLNSQGVLDMVRGTREIV